MEGERRAESAGVRGGRAEECTESFGEGSAPGGEEVLVVDA